MNVRIWYMYHSGFAVQTAEHFLVFDYWKNMPKGGGLEDGVIDPSALSDKNVIVFASHRHGDHYSPEILGWSESNPSLQIVLSDDISAPGSEALMIGPGGTLAQPDFTVRAFTSNDEGVAFLVDIDGLRIYHAGDLNWWHWEGEPDEWNAGMARSYKAEVGNLSDKPIDLAFIPVDPRLEEQYAWGIDYFMRTADVRRAVPMHFADDPSVVDRLLGDALSEGYRDRIVKLTRRGESAEITF